VLPFWDSPFSRCLGGRFCRAFVCSRDRAAASRHPARRLYASSATKYPSPACRCGQIRSVRSNAIAVHRSSSASTARTFSCTTNSLVFAKKASASVRWGCARGHSPRLRRFLYLLCGKLILSCVITNARCIEVIRRRYIRIPVEAFVEAQESCTFGSNLFFLVL
jgi:hypothetical protein